MSELPILYLSKDETKNTELKSLMTDELWCLVKIEYCEEDPYLKQGETTTTGTRDIVAFIYGKTDPITISKKLRNARQAAIRIYDKVKTGDRVKASQDIIDLRRSICDTCPFKYSKWLGSACGKCGCNIKSKTTLITESCPIHKW